MTDTLTAARVRLPELSRRMGVNRSLVYACKNRFATLHEDTDGILTVAETEAADLVANGIPRVPQTVSVESAFQRRRNVRDAVWQMLADVALDIDDNDVWWTELAEANSLPDDEMAAIRANIHDLLCRKARGYLRS